MACPFFRPAGARCLRRLAPPCPHQGRAVPGSTSFRYRQSEAAPWPLPVPRPPAAPCISLTRPLRLPQVLLTIGAFGASRPPNASAQSISITSRFTTSHRLIFRLKHHHTILYYHLYIHTITSFPHYLIPALSHYHITTSSHHHIIHISAKNCNLNH